MADLWLPPDPLGGPVATRAAGNSSGFYMPFSTWCLLLHTIEGRSMSSALAAYRANNSWPHMTFDHYVDELLEHVPLNRPARSLRNQSGGVQTNRYRVVQVELVGFAAESHTWSDESLARIGRLVARIHRLCPFDLDAPLPFLGEGDGLLAAESARQRMSFAQWYRFRAICGHQHAPENTHWDPGRINVARILEAAHEHLGSVSPLPGRPAAPNQEDPHMVTIVREDHPRGAVWACDHGAGTRRWLEREELDLIIRNGGLRHQDPEAKPGWQPPREKTATIHGLRDITPAAKKVRLRLAA